MSKLIFDTGDDEAESRRLRRAFQAGKLERIYSGIYIEPGGEGAVLPVRRAWPEIVHFLFPTAVVTDRSGQESQPSTWTVNDDRFIFLSRPGRAGIVSLPGLNFVIRDGIGPIDGEDVRFVDTYTAGPVRRLLDNIAPSRSRNTPSRTIGPVGVETILEKLCNSRGEAYLNAIRDSARDLAPKIDRDREFQALDSMIGGLLATREEKMTTDVGRARAARRPFDPDCITQLRLLNAYLNDNPVAPVPNPNNTIQRRPTSAFIEAYFSNYIEGTEFAVQEARGIVFEGKIPEARPADGHDVLGTYRKLMEPAQPSLSKMSPVEFIELLQADHADFMSGRPAIGPGVFKQKANKAGSTQFVSPDLVRGTLHTGFEMVSTVKDPFARAIMAHHLISEVHPFNDGNGRMSRIFMSRELTVSGLCHIVVPTVFRSDYLDALRALSRWQNPAIFVRSMARCQIIAAACSNDSQDAAIANWASTYAFLTEGTFARFEAPNAELEIEWRDDTPAPSKYWRALDNAKNDGFGF